MRSCSEQRSKKRRCAACNTSSRILRVRFGVRFQVLFGVRNQGQKGAVWGVLGVRYGGVPETPTPPMLTARFGLALAFSGATAEPRENPSHIPPMSPL